MICSFCAREIPAGDAVCPVCGFRPLSPEEAAAVGVDGYSILGEIGRGGVGVVYLAIQKSLDRPLALKMLPRGAVPDEAGVEDFFREAKTAAKLDHPNIVRMIEAGRTDGGNCYFSMELVRGITAEDQMSKCGGRFEFRRLLSIAIAVADALDYGYREFTLTHGDIKPSNLLIRGSDGVVKLADFGLARFAHEKREGDVVATPMYTAPEIVENGQAGFGLKADMYSFGIMLYEMESGSAPFTGTPEEILAAHVARKVPPLETRDRNCNRDFAGLVAWLLSGTPEERPESWRSVLDCLKVIRRGLTEDGRKQIRSAARIRRIAAVSAAVALLVLGAAVFFMLRKAPEPSVPEPVKYPSNQKTNVKPERLPPVKPILPAPVAPAVPAPVVRPVPAVPVAPVIPVIPAVPVVPEVARPVAPPPAAPVEKPAVILPEKPTLPPSGDTEKTTVPSVKPVAVSVKPPEPPPPPTKGPRKNTWRHPEGKRLAFPFPRPRYRETLETSEPTAQETARINASRKTALDALRRRLSLYQALHHLRRGVSGGGTDQPAAVRAELALAVKMCPRRGLVAGTAPVREIFRNYLIFNSGDFARSRPKNLLRGGETAEIQRLDTVGITVSVPGRSGRETRQTLDWVLFDADALRGFVVGAIRQRKGRPDDMLKTVFVAALNYGFDDVAEACLSDGNERKLVPALGAAVRAAGQLPDGAPKRYSALSDAALTKLLADGGEPALNALLPEAERAFFAPPPKREPVRENPLRLDRSGAIAALFAAAPEKAPYLAASYDIRHAAVGAGRVFTVAPVIDTKSFFASVRAGSFEFPTCELRPDGMPWSGLIRGVSGGVASGGRTPRNWLLHDPQAAPELQSIQNYLEAVVGRRCRNYFKLTVAQRFLALRRSAPVIGIRLPSALWEIDSRRVSGVTALAPFSPEQLTVPAALLALRGLLLPGSGATEEEITVLTSVPAGTDNPSDRMLAAAFQFLRDNGELAENTAAALKSSSAPAQWKQLFLEWNAFRQLAGKSGLNNAALSLLAPGPDDSSILEALARSWLLSRFATVGSATELAEAAQAATEIPSYAMIGVYDDAVFASLFARVAAGVLSPEEMIAEMTGLLVGYSCGGRETAAIGTFLLRSEEKDPGQFFVLVRRRFGENSSALHLMLLYAALNHCPEAVYDALQKYSLPPVERLYAVRMLSLLPPAPVAVSDAVPVPPAQSGDKSQAPPIEIIFPGAQNPLSPSVQPR